MSGRDDFGLGRGSPSSLRLLVQLTPGYARGIGEASAVDMLLDAGYERNVNQRLPDAAALRRGLEIVFVLRMSFAS